MEVISPGIWREFLSRGKLPSWKMEITSAPWKVALLEDGDNFVSGELVSLQKV